MSHSPAPLNVRDLADAVAARLDTLDRRHAEIRAMEERRRQREREHADVMRQAIAQHLRDQYLIDISPAEMGTWEVWVATDYNEVYRFRAMIPIDYPHHVALRHETTLAEIRAGERIGWMGVRLDQPDPALAMGDHEDGIQQEFDDFLDAAVFAKTGRMPI